MDYQTALTIPYIYELVSCVLYGFQGHPSNRMELLNLENIFYFKQSNGDLLYINSNTKLDSSITEILNTGILFEENDGDPLLFYKQSTLHNGLKSNINYHLYQALTTNKIKKRK